MEEGNLPKDVNDNKQPNIEIETKQSFNFNSLFDKIANELKDQRLAFLDYLKFIKNQTDENKQNIESRARKNWLFWFQVLSLFATVGALFFTYIAISKADAANQISKDALKHAIFVDSNENIRRNKDAVLERLKDSITDASIKESLIIAKNNADASADLVQQSINSLKDVQKRFHLENQPIFKIVPKCDSGDSSLLFSYNVINKGKFPVFRIDNFYIFEQYDKNKESDKINTLILVLQKHDFIRKSDASIISDDPNDREEISNFYKIITSKTNPIVSQVYFLSGKIFYKEALENNKIKSYIFIIRLEVTRYFNFSEIKFNYKNVYSEYK